MTKLPLTAVLLDRDGVLNERPPEHDYVRSASEFRWLPGSLEALVELAVAGLSLACVSNQRGIARGLVSWSTLSEIEAGIQADLGRHGVGIAGFYYCPHELDEGCHCRKPEPGLLRRAARELGLDLRSSAMVGDSAIDVAAGRACGCLAVRVGVTDRSEADLVAPDLAAAASALLSLTEVPGGVR